MRREWNENANCSLCGGKSVAVWHVGASPPLDVCESCAIDVLPRLIADAVHARAPHEYKQAIQNVERAFWEAAAIRIWRELEEPHRLPAAPPAVGTQQAGLMARRIRTDRTG